jgi:hypothetical protein
MSLIQLLIVLIVLGVGLWLINTYVPMSSSIKSIINIVVVIVAVLYVLSAFGIIGSFSRIRIGALIR